MGEENFHEVGATFPVSFKKPNEKLNKKKQ